MRLGVSPPYDADTDDKMARTLTAMRELGIRGTMVWLPNEEDQWEQHARKWRKLMQDTGMTILEVLPSFSFPVRAEQSVALAEKTVRFMEAAESYGCLNATNCLDSLGAKYGPHPDNRSPAVRDAVRKTCDLIAASAARKGLRVRMQIEMLYVSFLWNPQVTADFIDEVNSPHIRAHMDIANCLSFDNIYDHAQFIRDAFATLKGRFHSAHLKDLKPVDWYLPAIEEVEVGRGRFDHRTHLECLAQLAPDFPVLIEHLRDMPSIERAYRHITGLANEMNIPIWSD